MEMAVLLGAGVATREAFAPTELLERTLGGHAIRLGTGDRFVTGHDPAQRFAVDAHYSKHLPDILVLPGGFGALEAAADTLLVDWIDRVIERGGAVLTVSTGSLPLCATGRMIGRSVAGHWLCETHMRALGSTLSPYPMETHGRIVTTSGTAAALGGASFLADLARWGPPAS